MQRVIQKVAWLVQHQQITQVLYISQEHCYICHSTYSLVINTNLRGCHGNIFVNCLLLLTHDGVNFPSHIAVFSLKITHTACSSYVKSYHESSHCQLSITYKLESKYRSRDRFSMKWYIELLQARGSKTPETTLCFN